MANIKRKSILSQKGVTKKKKQLKILSGRYQKPINPSFEQGILNILLVSDKICSSLGR